MIRYIGGIILGFCLMMILGMVVSGCDVKDPGGTEMEETGNYSYETPEVEVPEIEVPEIEEPEVEEPELSDEHSEIETPSYYETGSVRSMVVGKQCGGCGRMVSMGAQVGQRCPHCGGIWGYQKYKYVNSLP